MTRGRKRRSRAARSGPAPFSGWIWMLFGLAVGLSVAAGIYVNDRRHMAPIAVVQPERAPAPDTDAADRADVSSRFDFYELLPKFEVVIPEEDLEARPDVGSNPVESPGVYVLQAGSYSGFADADRVKAQLALLGIVSRIQKVSIDEKTFHRVRIGPVESLEELNQMRRKLRQAEIEVMVIRVGD